MYITSLASRDAEVKDIIKEFNDINCHSDFCAEVLEDVIEHIEIIQSEKNVEMCKQLDKSLLKFKNSVVNKIDFFEGNIYTSSMIPVVLKI